MLEQKKRSADFGRRHDPKGEIADVWYSLSSKIRAKNPDDLDTLILMDFKKVAEKAGEEIHSKEIKPGYITQSEDWIKQELGVESGKYNVHLKVFDMRKKFLIGTCEISDIPVLINKKDVRNIKQILLHFFLEMPKRDLSNKKILIEIYDKKKIHSNKLSERDKKGAAFVKKKLALKDKNIYQDLATGFQIKVPDKWEKINKNNLKRDHYVKYLQTNAIFKGPVWKDKFPVICVIGIPLILGPGMDIGNKAIRKIEKEIKILFHNEYTQLKKIKGKTSFIGNIKVIKLNVVFVFLEENYQMECYFLEGNDGFILMYIANEKDFVRYSNQAIQAIRTFKRI